MIVSDLKANPAPARRKSTRKHEGVRNPTARNAIIRDRSTGMYRATAEGGELGDFFNEVLIRLNALELNVSSLMREDSVNKGHAAPLPSNVIPMSGARKAKEQSTAAQVSQPGNEAEALALSAPTPALVQEELPLKTGNTEPKFIGKAEPIPSGTAANDDLMPPETREILSRFMVPGDIGVVEVLADRYDMDVVEASEILYRESQRRNKHCIKTHGKPIKEVREERARRKANLDFAGEVDLGLNKYLQVKQCLSAFTDWWCETESRMKHLNLAARARQRAEWRTTPAPLIKGEAKYRKKEMITRAASGRRANPEGFAHVQRVSSKLDVGGPVTSAAQWGVITTAGWSLYQKTRKLFGMQPTVRGQRKRDAAEVAHVLSVKSNDGEPVNARRKGTAPADAIAEGVTQAELVRRYQRAGIGH